MKVKHITWGKRVEICSNETEGHYAKGSEPARERVLHMVTYVGFSKTTGELTEGAQRAEVVGRGFLRTYS